MPLPAKTQPVAGDSHVASLLGMTNLGALHVHRECLHICNCQWRSVSAATDAIGAHHFIDTRYGLRVQRRERHAAPLQQQVRSAECHQTYKSARRSLTAATPYFSAVSVLTAVGTRQRCLHEIATSACGLLAMTNLGAITVLAIARANRSCSAGSGMPLPYNGVCGRRSATKPTSLQGGH